jgi:hypothetical protein
MRHPYPLDVPKARQSVMAEVPYDMLRDGVVKPCRQALLLTSDPKGGGQRRSRSCMGAVGEGGRLPFSRPTVAMAVRSA